MNPLIFASFRSRIFPKLSAGSRRLISHSQPSRGYGKRLSPLLLVGGVALLSGTLFVSRSIVHLDAGITQSDVEFQGMIHHLLP